jgi:ATP-dependent DNA helicase Q4
LTLVVSPMISLMTDQLRCLPSRLKGALLSSGNESAKVLRETISRICKNDVNVLFISPERLRFTAFLELIKSRKIPPINFACVDEVHCMSEWSHNFRYGFTDHRTSYLHLASSLREDLKIKCTIGMTGTATEASKNIICDMLSIQPENVISQGVLRSNLKMTVSLVVNIEERYRQLNLAKTNSLVFCAVKRTQVLNQSSYM